MHVTEVGLYPCWGRGGQAVIPGPSLPVHSLCALGVCRSMMNECVHTGGGEVAPTVCVGQAAV